MIPTPKRWSDNAAEDYFLDLLVNKHIIDREIHDTIDVINNSTFHDDYKSLLKKVLFWEKNLYLENWWTLGGSLMDMIHTKNIRGHEIEVYGVVLGIMLCVVEEVCDVDDAHLHDFLLSEEREDVEHRLIILMKRVLDFIETGLKEMITHIRYLDKPIVDGHVRKEFSIIRDSLFQYSRIIMEAEGEHIRALKLQVDAIIVKISQKKKNLSRIAR